MELLKDLLGAGGGSLTKNLGANFGLDGGQTRSALENLLPALAGGMKRNTTKPGGMESLLGALKAGNHARYVEDDNLLGQESTRDDGNKILGHLLGSKQASREVAARASEKTGIDGGVLKKMLPLVATMAMGALSKRSGGGRDAKATGLLGSLIDGDGDGNVIDDVLGAVGKFL